MVCGWAPCWVSIVTGQEMINLQKRPETGVSTIDFGVDKVANTFVFTGNALVDVRALGGLLQFSNIYRGSAFRTTTTAVRDDQLSTLSYEHTLSPTVSTLARSSWIVSRDNRSIGLSSLQRLNGVAGLRYNDTETTAEAYGGLESTTQLGVQALGPLAGLSGTIGGLDLEPLTMSASVLADWHRIDSTRTNMDAQARLQAEHHMPDGSYLQLGVGGLTLKREFLTTLAGGTSPDAVESRIENKFDCNLDVNYLVTPQLRASVMGSVNVNGIARGYGNVINQIAVTAVQRHLEEFMMDLQGMVAYSGKDGSATASATVFRRTEDNTVQQHFSLDELSLAQLEQQEYLRDNRTSRIRFLANGMWYPTDNDTVSADYTWWLLQYDTPSDGNNDDRDELSAIASLRYARRMSEVMTAGIAVGGQFVHTVYIKAARSAFNNRYNVLRLSPFVRIQTRGFSMHPNFEVLANYTVYDFEGKGAQARSYGYRQISYRDSIRIHLAGTLRLEVPALVRYFERSTLLWSDFAEIPQVGNLEYLVNTRIFARPSLPWDVGVGIRWYTFEQRSLVATSGLPSIIGSIRSWAPEVVVRFHPSNGSTLDVSGWYEFQTLAPAATRELPNLLLHAHVAL